MTVFIELEDRKHWINADRITGMFYHDHRIDLLYLGAGDSDGQTIVSGIDEKRAELIVKDIALMFAEGKTVTQDWIDDWCQSDGASEWERRAKG